MGSTPVFAMDQRHGRPVDEPVGQRCRDHSGFDRALAIIDRLQYRGVRVHAAVAILDKCRLRANLVVISRRAVSVCPHDDRTRHRRA
jgi:hypothetical protein